VCSYCTDIIIIGHKLGYDIVPFWATLYTRGTRWPSGLRRWLKSFAKDETTYRARVRILAESTQSAHYRVIAYVLTFVQVNSASYHSMDGK
jgi:hypothetical protein